jgi:hypothetical protein
MWVVRVVWTDEPTDGQRAVHRGSGEGAVDAKRIFDTAEPMRAAAAQY